MPANNVRHRMCHTSEYQSWARMKYRCKARKNDSLHYKSYVLKNITVCDRWQKFENFIEDMGQKPQDGQRWTIERKDNDLGYFPENCVWATVRTQANNRSNNVFHEFDGKNMTLPQWARYLGINRSTLEMRIYARKWSIDKALTTPVKNKEVIL